jgi:hypothetical protein
MEFTTGKTLFLDARNAEDFECGTIPGAINIPFESLPEGDLNKYFDSALAVAKEKAKRTMSVRSKGDTPKRILPNPKLKIHPSQLSTRAKRQTQEATDRQKDLERLYALSRAILLLLFSVVTLLGFTVAGGLRSGFGERLPFRLKSIRLNLQPKCILLPKSF